MNCLHRRWFLEVFPSPCRNFRDRIMPEGQKIIDVQYWFSALTLAHRDFWWNWWLYALQVMRYSKSSQFDIEDYYSEIFPQVLEVFFFPIDYWTSNHLGFWETAPLMLLLYLIMLLTCCQLTWLVTKCFSSCFLVVPLTFPGFCCPNPTFLRQVATIEFRKSKNFCEII